MMVDQAFSGRALQWLDAGYFTTTPLGWMFKLFHEYWQRYESQCTDIPLREAVARLSEDKLLRYRHEIELVIALNYVPEREYVKDKLGDFCKRAIFAGAHDASAKLFNKGEPEEAYDTMARAQERIQAVTFEVVDRSWLFDELSERNRKRMRDAMDPLTGVFTTGIQELDDLTDGGVHKGEVFAVLAYAKRCKTTWLINQGFHATRVHMRPTVHFILEGKGNQITARYDACFSQELYTRVKRGDIDAQLYRQMAQEYQGMRRMCVVRTLNDWDVTILDIQAELSYLRTQGFIPEMSILDYVDLGRSRDRVDGETAHQVNFSRDYKRLINNTDMAGWTAWQAQRPKEGANTKEHVLTSSNVADAYAKVRIVDAYGSLNATDDEMARGEMRVFWEGHRDAAVNKLWTITNDLSRMRMLTSATEYVPPQKSKDEFADN